MFSRVLSLALCLACAPCLAKTIVDGTHALFVTNGENDDSFAIQQPAHIDLLRVMNGAKVDVHGGSLDRVELYGERMSFVGGDAIDEYLKLRRMEGGTTIDFHVRMAWTFGDPASESFYLYAWMLNGDYLQSRVTKSPGDPATLNFIQYDLAVDPTGDGFFGIDDLNAARNDFGSPGIGDLDGSGIVDIGDLNTVRNNFGKGVNPEWPGELSPVPEPTSLVLFLLMATCSRFLRFR